MENQIGLWGRFASSCQTIVDWEDYTFFQLCASVKAASLRLLAKGRLKKMILFVRLIFFPERFFDSHGARFLGTYIPK